MKMEYNANGDALAPLPPGYVRLDTSKYIEVRLDDLFWNYADKKWQNVTSPAMWGEEQWDDICCVARPIEVPFGVIEPPGTMQRDCHNSLLGPLPDGYYRLTDRTVLMEPNDVVWNYATERWQRVNSFPSDHFEDDPVVSSRSVLRLIPESQPDPVIKEPKPLPSRYGHW